MKNGISIFWFRRDLRLNDNKGLYHSLIDDYPVLPIFIFDTLILEKLACKNDKRVVFIHNTITQLNIKLMLEGSALFVFHGTPIDAFRQLYHQFPVRKVFTNHDYEPYAIERDSKVKQFLSNKGIPFHSFKDQVIFEKSDILNHSGKPYKVFTPYSRAWKQHYSRANKNRNASEDKLDGLLKTEPFAIPSINDMGFRKTKITVPDLKLNTETLKNYNKERDIPALDGTSRLSVHLRYGTVSIRELAEQAVQLNELWLNELIWREFFMMILYHYPFVTERSFKKEYDNIKWRNNEQEFDAWCKGETGYPLVDAGMRQLNETGWMHNRVRMVTAGFLTKILLIDWRWGEAYFAEKLLDYELASNNGNWQWVAGSGCDAAPYFRIFNPHTQARKFDPEQRYIRSWIKDYKPGYISPIVDHRYARERALNVYKASLSMAKGG